jgi:multiple sugar transport system substrate-binding protein
MDFWWWGESDAPGADKWLDETIAAYQSVHPNISINVVPQSTDTLQSAFQAAVASDSGPDIATQWATGPVLSYVWQNAIVPLDGLVPPDELQHWQNKDANSYQGKVWASGLYVVGTAIGYNKALFKQAGVADPAGARWTWDEFLAACAKLKQAGITPIVGGDKDGYLGAWWESLLGVQTLDSQYDIVNALVGNAPLTDPKYTGWYQPLEQLVTAGYFNDDISSLNLDQGVGLLSQRKGAMAFGVDGMVAQWGKDLGADLGVMRPPLWGTGKLAAAGNAGMSGSQFVTKWAKHPQEAADFIAFMHSPDRIAAWYQQTGVFVADDRFDKSAITDPILKWMADYETTGPQVFLESWLPPQVDGEANLPAAQLIFSRSGTPADAAQLWVRSADNWRTTHPDEVANWKGLVP